MAPVAFASGRHRGWGGHCAGPAPRVTVPEWEATGRVGPGDGHLLAGGVSGQRRGQICGGRDGPAGDRGDDVPPGHACRSRGPAGHRTQHSDAALAVADGHPEERRVALLDGRRRAPLLDLGGGPLGSRDRGGVRLDGAAAGVTGLDAGVGPDEPGCS